MARKKKKTNKKSPCPYCNSGKRYEKCCRKNILLNKKVQNIFERKEKNRRDFIEQYGHIKVPQLIEVWGTVVTLVGGSLYKQTFPDYNTFFHAVHDYALLFFGESYLIKQETLELEKRHPALQWMYAFIESSSKGTIQTGAGAAWIRFAYDIFTISDNATLEEKLKERLLKYKRFQGARHELWTAALFITAGFEIEFEDESDSSQTHPEFFATDKESGIRIAVEAKSRQRRGVKGFKQGSDKPLGEEVSIRKIISKAYKKELGEPLCVIVDTNLPPQSEKWDLNYWLDEINQTLAKLAVNGCEDPCPANLLLFHNDPSHYMVNEEIGFESDCLWISDYVPERPKNTCDKTLLFRDRLVKAHKQRLHPPVEIPDI